MRGFAPRGRGGTVTVLQKKEKKESKKNYWARRLGIP